MSLLNKKIASFDMDGTLTESKQSLQKNMSDLLCSLAKKKKVAIITGGSYGQFQKQFLPYFSVDKENENTVYGNLILLPTSGSQRYEFNLETREWQMTDMESFPSDVKEKVLIALQEIIDSGHYGIAPAIEGDHIIEDRGTQITMSALGQNAPLSLKSLWDPKQLKRLEMKAELEKKLPEIDIIIGGTTSLDILPKGFSKAKGLIRLLDKLGMTKEDMIFFGDAIFPGGNDYSVYEAGIESIKVSGPDETFAIISEWVS